MSFATRRPPIFRPLYSDPSPDPPAPPVEVILPGRAPAAPAAPDPLAPTPGDPIHDQALNALIFAYATLLLWAVARDIIETLSGKEAQ